MSGSAVAPGSGSLYRRFGSKEALVADVLIDGLAEIQSWAEVALDPWAALSGFLYAYTEARLANLGLAEFTSGTVLANAIGRLARRAQDHGVLRADVTWRDLALISISPDRRNRVPRGHAGRGPVAPDDRHRARRPPRPRAPGPPDEPGGGPLLDVVQDGGQAPVDRAVVDARVHGRMRHLSGDARGPGLGVGHAVVGDDVDDRAVRRLDDAAPTAKPPMVTVKPVLTEVLFLWEDGVRLGRERMHGS